MPIKSRAIYVHVLQIVYEHGGECFVNATVDEIIIENGRAVGVRLCKSTSIQPETVGEKPEMYELRAPIIVNATGIHNLYNRLLPSDLPLAKEFKATNRTIPSFGHMYLFVTIKGKVRDFIIICEVRQIVVIARH